MAWAADTGTIEPKDLAATLETKAAKPVLIHVGFGVMYRGKHIPGSIYAGPARTPDGIAALKKAVANLPKDREIVIYCGCCPYEMCPNVRPAMAALREMGFTHVKTLMIPTNFATDWVNHGYPVEEGKAGGGEAAK
ncbi:MAG TPA: rhodanese-like domain-containing protein [Bryobacteraceae bacterium]|nr:rhodanese-like domain-containing protein [Bryobacteraceae bacterium]